MIILRWVIVLAGLLLLGLGLAYVVTRNRRYLSVAWRLTQVVLLLLVAAGLLYVFQRVLLVI